ncbi:hypothetical protein R6Q57_008732 [Mikania cordata]
MELKSGLSAFVTGGASGIGRALSIALAQKEASHFLMVPGFSLSSKLMPLWVIEYEN